MDKHLQQHDRAVKLMFGPDAIVTGCMATGRTAGTITVMVGDVTLGVGPDFDTALRAAQLRASQAARERPGGMVPTITRAHVTEVSS